MGLESYADQFCIVKGANRQFLYGDFNPPAARIETRPYSEGELGLISKALIEQFNKGFPIGQPQLYEIQHAFVRPRYRSEINGIGNLYVRAERDIPVILFDPREADMQPTSTMDEKVFSNPGYFIAILEESEFQVIPNKSLHNYLTGDQTRESYRWLKAFHNLMPLESFASIPIEIVARNIPQSEADKLIEFYSKGNENTARRAKTQSFLSGQIFGAEVF